MRRAFIGAGLICVLCVATRTYGQAARRWRPGTWSAIARVDGGPQGLGRIEALAFDGKALYTYDYESHALESFDLQGRARWRIDGSSAGMQPVSNASDLELDAEGHLWVVDSRSQRIDVYSSDGKLIRAIQAPRSVERVAPQANGTYWLFTPVDTTPSLYGQAGQLLAHPRLSEAIEKTDFVARNLWLTAMAGGGMVIAYRWSDRFVVVGPAASRWKEYRGLDRREFPRDERHPRSVNGMQVVQLSVNPETPVSAMSSDVDGGLFYEVFGVGAHGPDQEFRTIDAYDVSSGHYLGSYRLPAEIDAIRVRGDLFAAIVPGSPPSIVVWKWTPTH